VVSELGHVVDCRIRNRCGHSLNSFGNALRALRDLAALDILQRSQAILSSAAGPDHRDAASRLDNVGVR
jgi:hypothetical protein